MGGSSTTTDWEAAVESVAGDLAVVADLAGAAGLAGVEAVVLEEAEAELVLVLCAQTGETMNGVRTRSATAPRWSSRRGDRGLDIVTCFLGSVAGQGHDFSKWKRGQKNTLISTIKEMKAGRHQAEETPLPSCPWRDSSPDHEARDLMSAEKQVF
jgi:hypothetical protein